MEASEQRATSFLERARLRRRVAYLRRRRELALRQLGLAVLEKGDVEAQLSALVALEEERTKLEQALGEHRELAVLREPGIAVCPAVPDDPRQRRELLPELRRQARAAQPRRAYASSRSVSSTERASAVSS